MSSGLPSSTPGGADRIVRVLPDEPGLNKTFDYLLPNRLRGAAAVRVGAIVRFPLNGRQMRGWVTGVDVVSTADVEKLREISKVTGIGPPREILALSRWAAHRWWGRPASLLRTASPENAVAALPTTRPGGLTEIAPQTGEVARVAREALAAGGPTVVRIAPQADVVPLLLEAAHFAGTSGLLVVATSIREASTLARRLKRAEVAVALLPQEWARAAAGDCIVIGARSAAWGPLARPGAFVVLDEHDDIHQQEQMPTWNARDVVVERAARLGVPVLLVSPIPSLESVAKYPVFTTSRSFEREHWPIVDVIDRSDSDPSRQGLLSEQLGPVLRGHDTVVCVLNRKGRAAALVCTRCTDLAQCEICSGALASHASSNEELVCARCTHTRPMVCARCGGSSFKNIRMGTTRAREEIEALSQRAVAEVTAESDAPPVSVKVFVGTEAVLHRVARADTVVFLDFDSELLAPRYRASEHAMALVVRAARLLRDPAVVGSSKDAVGNRGSGRVLVQTRLSEHDVLRAMVLADTSAWLDTEATRRRDLRFPPSSVLAELSGAGGPAIAATLRLDETVEVRGPLAGPFLVRASSALVLADALAKCERPSERVRVTIDPRRV